MTLFLVSFAVFAIVIFIMAIGVMFGRQAIKGSCGGLNSDCACQEKCEKRHKREAAQNVD